MKNALLLFQCLFILALVNSQALADEAYLFKGSCRNVTHSVDGLLKLYVVEHENGTLDGYMSISGWLVGSGSLKGSKTGNTYQFRTEDPQYGQNIRWEGVKSGDSLSGEYYVNSEKQAGEWELSLQSQFKVGETVSKEAFEHYFMLKLETDLNSNVTLKDGTVQTGAQALFSTVHPVGTGVSVCVDSVSLEWKDGAEQTSVEGIRRYCVEYTLFWQGIIQAYGHSKLRMTYNANLEQVTGHELISTTGTTNSDVENIAFGVGVMLGEAAMESLLQSE